MSGPKKEEKPKEEPKKEAAEGAEGAAPVKKSKKKIIIIAVVGLLVIGGGIAGAIMSGVLGGDDKKTEAKDKSAKHGDAAESGEAAAEGEDGAEPQLDEHGNPIAKKAVFLDLPDIVANLSSPTPRPHFINLKLTLEIASAQDLATIQDQIPRIKDAFNAYLREIRKEDLEGSAGMYRLENELMLRLEKLFGKDKVKDILFREIIVQ
jgi:flagellar FliL protein